MIENSDLFVALNDWHRMEIKDFQMSALYVFETKKSKSSISQRNMTGISDKDKNDTKSFSSNANLVKGIVFAGSFSGHVARYYLLEKKAIPASCSFGHSNKIVEFAPCKLPIILDAVASLSYDGTICLWSVFDGICTNKYEHILPNGCQHLAISQTAIEICAVSGAFAPVYIVNIQEGVIMQQIHPCNSFIVGMDFYSTSCCSWLFTIDSKGIATYDTLTPATAKNHKIRLFAPKDNSDILFAKPNADFTYLLAASSNHIYFVPLTVPNAEPHILTSACSIHKIVWISNYVAGIIQVDGHFTSYNIPKPRQEMSKAVSMSLAPGSNVFASQELRSSSMTFKELENKTPRITHADVLAKLIEIPSDGINSSIKVAQGYNTIHKIVRNTISHLDPLSIPTNEDAANQQQAPQVKPPTLTKENHKITPPIPVAQQKIERKSKLGKLFHHKHHKTENGDKRQQQNESESESESPISESSEDQSSSDESASENLKPFSVITNQRTEDPFPVIAGFAGKFVIGSGDTLFIEHYQWSQFPLTEDKNLSENAIVTAQCYIWSRFDSDSAQNHSSDDSDNEAYQQVKDDESTYEISMLVEGFSTGEVVIHHLNRNKPDLKLKKKHQGKVVALFATKQYLFTSGEDCLVYIYDIHSQSKPFTKIQTISYFTTPVTRFYRLSHKTHSIVDHSIFCITSGNVVLIVNLKHLDDKRIMSGHDGEIKNMYFHATTHMLLIECHSLYFWSLTSSNLESVVTGYKKELYLRCIKNNIDNYQYVPVLPATKYRNGILMEPLILDSIIFPIPLLNIRQLSYIIHEIMKTSKPNEDISKKIPNFHLIYSLLTSKGIDYLSQSDIEDTTLKSHNHKTSDDENDEKKRNQGNGNKSHNKTTDDNDNETEKHHHHHHHHHHHQKESTTTTTTTTDSESDQKLRQFENINPSQSFSIGFVGSKHVLTVFLPQIKEAGKSRFQISQFVSSVIVSARVMFSYAFGNKSNIPKSFSRFFEVNLTDLDFSLFYFLRFTYGCSSEVHDFVLKMLSEFSIENRKYWLSSLSESRKQFPHYRSIFSLLRCSIAETMGENITKEEIVGDIHDLMNVINTNETIAPYARRLILNKIDFYLLKANLQISYDDLVITIVEKLAENSMNNEIDSNSLSLYFNQNPANFFKAARKVVQNGNKKAGIGFMNQIAMWVIDNIPDNQAAEASTYNLASLEKDFYDQSPQIEKLDASFYHKAIKCLMVLFNELDLKDSTPILKIVADKVARFAFSPRANSIAYGSTNGTVYVYVKYAAAHPNSSLPQSDSNNQLLNTSDRRIYTLCGELLIPNSGIRTVNFDSNGYNIIVSGKIQLHAIKVTIESKEISRMESTRVSSAKTTNINDEDSDSGVNAKKTSESGKSKTPWIVVSPKKKVRLVLTEVAPPSNAMKSNT